MGVSRLKSHLIREAILDFKQSEMLEENPSVYDGLGCCYHALKDFDEAIDHFNKAISAKPTNVEFLKNRAQCYFDMNMYQAAIDDLNTALIENSRDPQVLYKQGIAYFAFKKYKKCIATMKQALMAKPFMTYEADIFYHLGLSYCRLEKFEKSIFPYTRCIEKIPSDLRYIHERAKAYQMIEEHEKAVLDFDTVIKKNSKNAHAYFRRAFSLKALKVSSILIITNGVDS